MREMEPIREEKRIRKDKRMREGALGAIAAAVIIAAIVAGGFLCIEKIPAGYAGIVYNGLNGGVDGEVLTQGWHLVSPAKKVTTYSIGIEQSYLTSEDKGDSPADESFSAPTSDGKSVTVDLEFSYKFDQNKIADTFIMFKGQSGKDVKNTFIKPKMRAWTQEVTAKYPVTDVFCDKRQELNEALDVYLKAKFEPYGIIIDTVNFTNISTDTETAAAIQKKVTAQQELELATIEAKTAKVQAEKDKQVAEISAEQKRIQAQADADAMKIKADAEAEANKEIAASLTPELIEKLKYDTWDGKLPTVQGSGTPIISVEN